MRAQAYPIRGVDMRWLLRDLGKLVDEMVCVRCERRLPYFPVVIDPQYEDVHFDDTPCPICSR